MSKKKKKKDFSSSDLDVPVDDLVLVQVAKALQDLPGVEDDGGLLQGTPFGTQQCRQAPWRRNQRLTSIFCLFLFSLVTHTDSHTSRDLLHEDLDVSVL